MIKEETFKNKKIKNNIINVLTNIYDPEMPLVDIRTLGLIYKIEITNKKEIKLLITFTTPACPMADIIIQMIKKEIKKELNLETIIEVTFDPQWNVEMIKDEEIKLYFI